MSNTCKRRLWCLALDITQCHTVLYAMFQGRHHEGGDRCGDANGTSSGCDVRTLALLCLHDMCLHDMMGNISVDISGFHLTNQMVQRWQKPTFIRTAERMLHITHHIMNTLQSWRRIWLLKRYWGIHCPYGVSRISANVEKHASNTNVEAPYVRTHARTLHSFDNASLHSTMIGSHSSLLDIPTQPS